MAITRQNFSSGTKWEPVVGYSRAVRVGDRIRLGRPTPDAPRERDALPQPAFLADRLGEPRHLLGHALLMGNGLIEGRRYPPVSVGPMSRQSHAEIAVAECLHGRQNLAQLRFR